jgi:glycosyltransferase involved in cell wall biosynthesis
MNMSKSTLSIVVPAYNQGPFIEETVRSILEQTERPDEILISNNHSTDQTAEVLSRYADKVTIIQPPEHLPGCAHGNFVFSQAKGDWVALLSSDDAALPNYVADFKRAIARHGSKAVLCRGGVEYMDNDSRFLADRRLLSVAEYEDGYRALRGQLENPKVFFAGFCVKRSAFEKVGGFKDYEAMGDWPLWLELCAEGGFCRVAGVLAKYRLNERPGLFRQRLPGEIRDEWRIRSEVIPRVLNSMGRSIPLPRLKKAARFRLIHRLNACLVEGVEQGDPALETVLDEWARYAGADDVVKNYRAGRPTAQEMSLLTRLRHRVVPIARKLITRVARSNGKS